MTQVHAGPLRMQLDGADLRYVRLGQHEVIRRLYVAVRDPEWNTVPPDVSDLRLETGEQSFRATFRCSHRQDGLDFRWQGTIVGDADGTLRYTMQGQAESTFSRARIGICVLHPIQPCAGAPFRVTHPDGSVQDGVLPRYISPHQPVMDIVQLEHPIAEAGWAELRFEGDVFEMEDQRNWTDASFKTYSTPLRLPLPVVVERGTRIDQSVSLRVRPREGWTPDGQDAEAPELVIGEAIGRLPAIGVGLGAASLGPEAQARLRALRLGHLRVDVDATDQNAGSTLERAVEAARAVGAPLEIALTLGADAERSLDQLRDRVSQLQPGVARWLVFASGEPSTPGHLVSLARERLGGGATFGGGSNTHFTELNRHRPKVGGWDFVAYPIMPQAHAFDETSIVETLEGQSETVVSARAFLGETPIVITPVTLRRRSRPGADGATRPAADWRSSDDPRQAAPFAAAWTLASLSVLAQAGVESVTYYEASGARGIMAANGDPYPVYEVLAALTDFAGGDVLAGASTDPLRIRGFGVRHAGRQRTLVANLTPQPLEARIRGAGDDRQVSLEPFGTLIVDA